jgi:two-component system, LytTR family, response regulator
MLILQYMAADTITYILAEDELVHQRFAQQELAKITGLQCLAVCTDALATRLALQTQQPDLLILDIEMPGLSGIELAQSLAKPPHTVFITAHPQYAAEAFELDAVDYLVKPVKAARLLKAIDKVRLMMQLQADQQGHDPLRIYDDASFFIRDKNTFVKISYDDVLYIESLGNFVSIVLQNEQKKLALVNLKNIEQQLPLAFFLRISRTHVVNKKKITAIDKQAIHINTIQLLIGKNYTDAVLDSVLGN